MSVRSIMSAVQIPCNVCQDPSTGMHYGVFSCDACKGFFGRHSKIKSRKFCLYGGKCNITGARKFICAACRYKRCEEVGMSRKAIKTGRYSLQYKQCLESEIQAMAEKQAREEQTRHSAELESRLRPDTRLGPNGESLEEIINKIVEAYDSLPSNLRFSQEYLDEEAQRYWDQYSLKETLFGKMSTVSAEEFAEIFSETGIDVDDRFQFSETYLNSVRRQICKLVRFTKIIPGFKQLPMEDQFNLLKYNRFEFWFLGAYRGYNPTLKVAVNPNGFCCHQEEFSKATPTAVSELMFDVARSLQRITPTLEEHIIVQTMALFFPDRAPLKDKAAVEALQSTLLTCLEYLVSKRPSPRDRVQALGQAIEMMTIIRRLSHVDDIKVSEKGWIESIKNAKVKILEEEMAMDSGEHSSQ